MTSFGDRVFTEVIKLNEAISVDPNPVMIDVLIYKGNLTETSLEGRPDEETEAEDSQLQARRETLNKWFRDN